MRIKHIKGNKKRKSHVVKRIHGNVVRLRLSVYRSNRYLYAQLIDDEKRETILSVSEQELSLTGSSKLTKKDRAKLLGALIASKAIKKNISKVVFDRNGYKYHGQLKIFADEARNGGLQF